MATNDSTDPRDERSALEDSETHQILTAQNPDAQGKPPIDPKWRPYEQRLLHLRDRLIDSHADLTSKAREIQAEAVKEEPSEAGTDEFQRDYALAMMTNQREMLYEIEAALRRIEAGTYGRCEVTGKSIPAERLDAIPWARCTIEGQRQLEQAGGTVRPGLGAIEGTDRAGFPEEREHVNVPSESRTPEIGEPETSDRHGRRIGIGSAQRPAPSVGLPTLAVVFVLGFLLGVRSR